MADTLAHTLQAPVPRRAGLVLLATLLSACGGGQDDPEPVTTDPPLPPRTWTYLPDAASHCGNGTTTGFAINPETGAETLLLYLQGGGACWDGLTCFGADGQGATATNFTQTVQKDEVLAEATAPRMTGLFDRSRADNPFRAMTQVYVPYCTGDMHTGTHAGTHTYLFEQKPAYHTGASNLDAFLKQIVPLSPQVKRVVLVGASAGGYGASFNWWRVRAAFGPAVRVDVLDDSGPLVDPASATLWTTWRGAWGLSTPPDCPACADTPTAWLPYYAATVPAPARYALISHTEDKTVAGYALLSGTELSVRLQAIRASMAERQKSYFLAGDDHVALDLQPWPTNGSGTSMTTWIQQFLDDAPGWEHSGP